MNSRTISQEGNPIAFTILLISFGISYLALYFLARFKQITDRTASQLVIVGGVLGVLTCLLAGVLVPVEGGEVAIWDIVCLILPYSLLGGVLCGLSLFIARKTKLKMDRLRNLHKSRK